MCTLWPFGDADPLPGTALLPGWLGRTIVALVTGYTRPGDRVLLLSPPLPRDTHEGGGKTRRDASYDGLGEAVWTITRLGRTADSANAAARQSTATSDLFDRSESGPRPQRPGPRTPTGLDRAPTGNNWTAPDRFDLIVTAVPPRTALPTQATADWLTPAAWREQMTDSATLAILTHGDYIDGRLIDPIPFIVSTLSSHSLRWHDHIAILDRPLPPRARSSINPNADQPTPSVPGASDSPIPTRRAHHDLLVFTPAPPPAPPMRAATTAAVETAEEGQISDD